MRAKYNIVFGGLKIVERKQGQRGATPKEICPKCGEYLQIAYIRKTFDGKRNFEAKGLICPKDACDYIVKK